MLKTRVNGATRAAAAADPTVRRQPVARSLNTHPIVTHFPAW